MFLTDFRYEGTETGTLCLGTDFPSKILKFSLEDFPDSTLICQKGAFLASNPHVNIEMEFTKSLSAGFFGGQGFVLQKLSGQGDVLVKGGGTVVAKELQDGETLRVTSGSLIAFENTVQYNVQMMPGIKNAMFGGEGLFVTTLQGPGRIWLQGMPPDRMIAEIARRVPGGGIGLGVPIGGLGSGGSEAGEGAGEAAGAAAGGEDMVAATDAAVEADRNATVASSGMMGGDSAEAVDPESPSALFGDAAADDVGKSTATDADASSFTTESMEPSFPDDDSTFASSQDSQFESDFSSQEPQFDDNDFANDDFQDGELFDDTASSAASTAGTGEEGGDAGGGFFQSLWDFFTDDE